MAMTGHVPLDHLKIVLGATKIPARYRARLGNAVLLAIINHHPNA